jgi:hypothetical protein
MLKLSVSYTNLIRVESIFAMFYAVFPQVVLEKPLAMRVQHTPALAIATMAGWERSADRQSTTLAPAGSQTSPAGTFGCINQTSGKATILVWQVKRRWL